MATNAVWEASQAKLMRREEVAEDTMAFHFEKPSGFTFKAGQSADVTLTNPPEIATEVKIGQPQAPSLYTQEFGPSRPCSSQAESASRLFSACGRPITTDFRTSYISSIPIGI
jgi:hypothetical protein